MRFRRAAVLGAGVLLLVALSALVVVRERMEGFSARAKPSAIEAFVARRLRRLAMPRALAGRTNPLPPTPLAIAEGRDHFADHCAVCHANDGSGRTAINEGLYPPAPDLRAAGSQTLSDGELLAVVRNGIRFTGMPGWGGTDDENWRLVLFIRHLPELTEQELRFMQDINGEAQVREH